MRCAFPPYEWLLACLRRARVVGRLVPHDMQYRQVEVIRHGGHRTHRVPIADAVDHCFMRVDNAYQLAFAAAVVEVNE